MKPTAPISRDLARANATTPAREFFVDWLRIIALGLLILYHVGMAYTGWNWHVKSASATAAVAALVEPWMRLTSPWRMSLLFVVSGIALALMLGRRATAGEAPPGWLRERARKLLLPLVTGVVLIVPPQAYFEVKQFHGYAGSYFEFLGLYFTAHGGFCTPQRGCLILPTWNHLWFLPYLFAYTALLAWVLKRWPRALPWAAERAVAALRGPWLMALPIAWLACTRWTLRPLFGETHAFVDDLFLHAQFLPAFVFGVLLGHGMASRPTAPAADLLARCEAQRHVALALALLGWLLLVTTAPAPWRVLPWSVMQWCAIVAALGYGRRHLQFDNAWRRRLSDAVFPVYLFHQTVTVAGVVWLAGRPFGSFGTFGTFGVNGALGEAALLLALTLGIGFVAYALLRRTVSRVPRLTWLAPWFGIVRYSVAGAGRPMASALKPAQSA